MQLIEETAGQIIRTVPSRRREARRRMWSEEVRAQPLLCLLGRNEPGEDALQKHCNGVGDLAAAIGRWLDLSTPLQHRLRLAGVLHDVGKVMVPRRILDKPGPLSSSEWDQIRRHPETGYLLVRSAGLDEIAEWVRTHHERPDGRGYPFGSKSRPLGGAIIAVADAFHAMTVERPYQQAVSQRDALLEMERCAGTQFEPEVVAALTGSFPLGPPNDLRHCHRRLTRT
jgi:HD-GYP domain-containing protein (c-di-GMP phosphodiesterase class II)